MFLPVIDRSVEKFDMDDAKDRARYADLLADPLVQVLEKKYQKQRQEEWQGEDGTVEETLYLMVEFERKSL